jgi:hypothetical protein
MYIILGKIGWTWFVIVTVLFLTTILIQGMQRKRRKRTSTQAPLPTRSSDHPKQ